VAEGGVGDAMRSATAVQVRDGWASGFWASDEHGTRMSREPADSKVCATCAPVSDDVMSFILAIKTQIGKRVGFPGNPIVKNRWKALKKGVKKVTFLQLDAGRGRDFCKKSGVKMRF
jgi:hypothetical protein